MRSSYLEPNSGVADVRKKVKVVNAALTLTAADSGSVFAIQQDSAYSITLPLAKVAGPGWHATFILSEVAANAVKVINNTDEDTIVGVTVGADASAGSSTNSTAVDEITFISGAQLGDKVELLCDGSYFYAEAMAHDVAHVTIA